MILKRQKIGSFQLVHELKGDGVELDMGSLGKREKCSITNCVNLISSSYFVKQLRNYNLEVPSIAMSGFYGQSFLDRANYKELVQDCLHAMRVMNTKVAFLPLGESKLDGKRIQHFEQKL